MIVGGDFFLAGTLVAALTKLVLRLRQYSEVSAVVRNSVCAEVLLIATSILRLGQAKNVAVDPDSYERIILCVNTLVAPSASLISYVIVSWHVFNNDDDDHEDLRRRRLRNSAATVDA